MTDKLALCMGELGAGCSQDEDTFRGVVRQCPFVTEQSVAEVLGLIARTQTSLAASDKMLGFSEPASQWNYAVIVDVLKQTKPDLDWAIVAELFDHPDFLVPDGPGFDLLLAAFKRGTGGQQIPIKALTGKQWSNLQVMDNPMQAGCAWSNLPCHVSHGEPLTHYMPSYPVPPSLLLTLNLTLTTPVQGQLSLLLHATSAPPEVYTFEQPADRRLPPVEGLVGGRSPHGTPNHAWLCRELLDVLCCLTEAGGFQAVRQILEAPAKICPEVRVCIYRRVHGI